MKRILFITFNNTVEICCVSDETLEKMSIEDYAKTKASPYASYEIIDIDDIPKDRIFRNAWVPCPIKKIKIDMPKAREIKKQHMRIQRSPKLEKLDIEFMRALEQADSDKVSSITAKKQALRDITKDPQLDLIDNPEDLKNYIPDCLKD